jgi:hypothetical protein
MPAGLSSADAAIGCSNFFSNFDGSWSPTHPILFAAPTSQVQLVPSDRLRAGAPGLSGRLGRYLDRHCRLGAAVVRPTGIPKVP